MLPPLTEVFGGEPGDDGGFIIPTLTPPIGHNRLHSGAMQVLAEAAALNAVNARLDRAAPRRITPLATAAMAEGPRGRVRHGPQVAGTLFPVARDAGSHRGAGTALIEIDELMPGPQRFDEVPLAPRRPQPGYWGRV